MQYGVPDRCGVHMAAGVGVVNRCGLCLLHADTNGGLTARVTEIHMGTIVKYKSELDG